MEKPESSSKSKKSYHIKTFGCQMNYHDTERMAHHIESQGYVLSPNIEQADLIIFNSCSIREKAQNKGAWIGRIKHIKGKNRAEKAPQKRPF